jgi:hypothetical protein
MSAITIVFHYSDIPWVILGWLSASFVYGFTAAMLRDLRDRRRARRQHNTSE